MFGDAAPRASTSGASVKRGSETRRLRDVKGTSPWWGWP
jgi:hypothetical protein